MAGTSPVEVGNVWNCSLLSSDCTSSAKTGPGGKRTRSLVARTRFAGWSSFCAINPSRAAAAHPVAPPGQFAGAGQTITRQLVETINRRRVAVLHVLGHHTPGAEDRTDRQDRSFHHLQPAARNAIGAARVERRHDLLLEQIVYRPALDVVLVGGVGVLLTVADRPAVVGFVSLDPPAVEDRQVQAAVAGHLH